MQTTIFGKTSNKGYSLLLAVLLSVICLVVDLRFPAYSQPVRYQLNGLVMPLYAVMGWPARFMDWVAEMAMTDEALHEENAYLKSQLLVLSGRVQKFSELAAENARLRGLLDSTRVVDGRVLIAEIISVDSDPFRHIVLLNKGEREGVYVGQPVLDARGIMGQIIEVGPQTARVMLIADREHALPVRVARNGIRAIVAGNGSLDKLQLQYVPESADVKVGDTLVSSGLGLRYPGGYPVAIVTRVGRSGTGDFAAIEVKPVAELDRSRHVLLLFNRSADQQAATVGGQSGATH